MAGKYDAYNEVDYDKIKFEKGSAVRLNVPNANGGLANVLAGVVIDPVTKKERVCYIPYDENFEPAFTPGQAFAYRFIAGCARKNIELPEKFKEMKIEIDERIAEVREEIGLDETTIAAKQARKETVYFDPMYENGLQLGNSANVMAEYQAAKAAAAEGDPYANLTGTSADKDPTDPK